MVAVVSFLHTNKLCTCTCRKKLQKRKASTRRFSLTHKHYGQSAVSPMYMQYLPDTTSEKIFYRKNTYQSTDTMLQQGEQYIHKNVLNGI